MRRHHGLYVGAVVLVILPLLGVLGATAWSQATDDPGEAGLPLELQSVTPRGLDDDLGEFLVFEGLVLLLGVLGCGLLLTGLEAFDAWRARRADEVAGVRGRIADALQCNRRLQHLAVTPVVHLPLWGHTRATVELRGHVPTPWLRAAVLRTAAREAAKHLAVFRIEDRLAIAPSREAEAA